LPFWGFDKTAVHHKNKKQLEQAKQENKKKFPLFPKMQNPPLAEERIRARGGSMFIASSV
tara:strand:- start:143 stop:322 length:180 start_codon:yes stop_codon:yes gene_type:complete